MYLNRLDTSNLKAWADKPATIRKPLVIQGLRQVGKTHLIKQFCKGHFRNFLYFNFESDKRLGEIFNESLEPKKILDKLSVYANSTIEPFKDVIVFDEAQLAPRALTALKYFRENMPEQHVIAAGSHLGLLFAGFTTERVSFPVGNVEFLELNPLRFQEFLESSSNKMLYQIYVNWKPGNTIDSVAHNLFWAEWCKFLSVGGMPEAEVAYFRDLALPRFDLFTAVRNVQRSLIKTYEADIAKHAGKVNALHIVNVIQAIPEKLARKEDGSSSKFTFQEIVPNVRNYGRLVNAIDWLIAVGIVKKVNITSVPEVPLSAFFKKNRFKLFLSDVGLLGAIADIPPASFLDYTVGMYKGYVAENFVLQELIAGGVPSLDTIASWEQSRGEIEFLVQLAGGIVPIEVKSGGKSHSASFDKYLKTYRPKLAILLCSKQGRVIYPKDRQNGSITVEVPIYMAGRIHELANLV